MSRISLRTLIALVAALALAAVPAVAQAHQGSSSGKSKKHRRHSSKRATKADRNRDGLPDRWERRFGLSLKVDQSGRDQDRDGLNNNQEFRAGTSPCDRDSDDDGVADKHENAGKIAAFDPQTQILTIELVAGGTISGKVTAQTEIRCRATAPTTTAAASRDGSGESSGSDDGPGHDAGDDHPSTTTPPAGTTPATSHHEDEGDEDHHDGDHGTTAACGTAQLTAGTAVHEAEITVTQDGPVFDEIKLVLPALAPATPAT